MNHPNFSKQFAYKCICFQPNRFDDATAFGKLMDEMRRWLADNIQDQTTITSFMGGKCTIDKKNLGRWCSAWHQWAVGVKLFDVSAEEAQDVVLRAIDGASVSMLAATMKRASTSISAVASGA